MTEEPLEAASGPQLPRVKGPWASGSDERLSNTAACTPTSLPPQAADLAGGAEIRKGAAQQVDLILGGPRREGSAGSHGRVNESPGRVVTS